MNERKEPTLSSMNPDVDAVTQHKSRPAQPSSGGRTPIAGRSVPVRPVIVKSPLGPIALIIALLGVGLAGYSYWQLVESQKTLKAADARIVELEKQLEMTGDESTASMAAVQAKLKWADSEIRKLWGVAYDRNKKSIEENTQAIAVLKKGAGSIDSKIKAALKDPKAEIRMINDLLDSQTAALSAVEGKSQAQMAQVQELTDKVRELDRLQSEFNNRIKTNEEAIRAIDAFRRNINQQLLQLKTTP